MNNFSAVGVLQHSVEKRESSTGSVYATFTLRVKRSRKEADGTYQSDFFDCVAFGATAEYLINYSQSGCNLACNGEIHINSYEDKEGVKRKKTSFEIRNVTIIREKSENTNQNANNQTDISLDDEIEISDDDLPF
jgi:single-strand DNA-binding protein